MARKSRKNLPDASPVMESQSIFYNAAAYVRLSSDDKKKRGDSLETQRNIIDNFAAASPDIRIMEVYSDNNATGTNFERQGFQQMLADAESGRINCIIVKDLSRFGRNAIDAGYYIEKYLPAKGIRFIAVTDDFDSNDGDANIMLPLKNLINESYALDISRKCKSVQRQNIREGRFVGRMAPYGYAKDPEDCHHLVVDPQAAAIVHQIFDWAAQGMGGGEIVRMLNEANTLPPSHYKRLNGHIANEKLVGKPYWQKRTITGILCDRVYVGDMVQGKSRTVNHKEIMVDPSEWVCVENTHEPIISRKQFDMVQRLVERASAQDKAVRRDAVSYTPNVFKGKVFCAHCGHIMHRHRQNKDGIYWFRCESQWKYKDTACVQVSVKEADLLAGSMIMFQQQSAAILGKFIRLAQETDALDNTAETRLREVSQQLQRSSRFLKSLYENLVSGLITADEFSTMKANYEAKIEMLLQEADEIRKRKREHEADVREARNAAEAVSEAVADKQLTAELIGRLVDKIYISRDKSFDIHLCFEDEFEEVKRVG